ncbi:hypothetical protein BLNAU_5175 [Blattamonas nauphoetae]|uniref:Protein kinase domain-containing protein n=1 Tax=Blattamonas nauphoetae TaxID=2049346 RepID=A0ABQ9Y8G7_9EUKA|nr:hypothetical protein BLNAU_5175 [Blattamonas nauphoetae]
MMLGCVVSLSSSHLSGSTLRDVNCGGSVLCSNSSFSSLLSSPHDNSDAPSITLPDGSSPSFDDTTPYSYNNTSGPDSSFASFSHCHFVSDPTPSSTRPLTFDHYTGSITLLSCSFTNAVLDAFSGGAVFLNSASTPDTNTVRIELCNFTDCSAQFKGGGLYLSNKAIVTVTGCRCGRCSHTETETKCQGGGMFISLTSTPDSSLSDLSFEGCTSSYNGGGLHLANAQSSHVFTSLSFKRCSALYSNFGGNGGGMFVVISSSDGDVASLSHLKFDECKTDEQGGGLKISSNDDPVSLIDCEFINCTMTTPAAMKGMGGGLHASVYSSVLNVTGCRFIDCSATALGGAMHVQMCGLEMSDCHVKNCLSMPSGAVCIHPSGDSPILLKDSLFVGNTVSDTPTYFLSSPLTQDAVQFADFLINNLLNQNPSDVSINNCWTTTPNSVGMYTFGPNPETGVFSYTRQFKDAFLKMGPYLTQKVEASADVVSRRIDVIVKGKVPLESQIYEMRLTEADGSNEMTGHLKFSDGVGSLLPSSNVRLEFSKSYVITSIVGVIPSSSEMNEISITTEKWAFNLAGSLDQFSFTTPDLPPPALAGSSAHLTDKDRPYAFIIVHFDREVSGSYEIVVEERGKDERIRVVVNGSSLEGESENILVVGDDRVLTHNSTYTIKSIVPSEGSETSTIIWMNKTITFTIPESTYSPGNEELARKIKALLSWLIPVVASVCLVVLVAIIVIVLLRRRKKNSQVAQKEMEDQVHFQVEDKMEVVDGDSTHQVICSDGMSHSAFDTSGNQQPIVHSTQEERKMQTKAESVEVMACSGGFEISATTVTNTLYSILHVEHEEIGKRLIGMQIVNGLKQVVAHRGWSDVLTRLSSHWILIDATGNVQLKLQMNASEAEQEAALTQMRNPNIAGIENELNQSEGSGRAGQEEQNKVGMDGLRWRAPEVVGSKGVGVDGHKASVFSLGLILWEIETGQVPYGELDAVNAQRQSGTGTPPKMESLKDEEFITLIHRCVSVDPEQRPTLTEVGEFLSSHRDETIGGSGNEMKE